MSYHLEHGIHSVEEDDRLRGERLELHVRQFLESTGIIRNPLPEGVRQEFIDRLDRVPKKSLAESDSCPICATPFLDDPYPLVVELPCPGRHQFNLECVSEWLKSSGTCPMCRYDFNTKNKEKTVAHEVVEEEEEEEYDDMYA